MMSELEENRPTVTGAVLFFLLELFSQMCLLALKLACNSKNSNLCYHFWLLSK